MSKRARRARPVGNAQPLLILAVALGAGTASARADAALLQPLKDATLIESSTGSLANGSGPAFFAGRNSSISDSRRRGVMAFDVAAVLPPGSMVTGVTLRLNLSATNAGPSPVRLHRLLAGWGEGASSTSGGGGAPAAPGDATWVHRFHDEVFWQQAGGDFDLVPRAAALVDQNGGYSWGPTPEMVADVQSWLDHPETAHGWLLAGDETLPTTVKRFDSREHPESANRPVLEVIFIPPCFPDPAGPGFWERQCAESIGGIGTIGESAPEEPGFADRILPCARGTLDDLGLPEVEPCEALLAPPPPTCRERAEKKMAVLVFNVCAGRLQTSCPVDPEDGDCSSIDVGALLLEISDLMREGDCRRASGCAGSLD
jgi:hypothetical protein